MKTTLLFSKSVLVSVVAMFAMSTASYGQSMFTNTVMHVGNSGSNSENEGDDDGALTQGLSFTNPTLKSGTDLQKGAVYLFKAVVKDIDATITIADLVNGAKVDAIDDNGSKVGYMNAWQPQVRSGNIIGRSYAEFRINFYKAGTTTLTPVKDVTATALDIDGSLTLKEFADIEMGTGATAKYMGKKLLDISLLNLLLGKFRAENIAGVERDGIDTTAFSNMYTASNANGITGFTVRYGTTTLLKSNSMRQFSMYMKGFAYPDVATLPLLLKNFGAELNDTKVDLKWTTGWEKQTNYFMVERSTDGIKYTEAGMVFAAGNSTSDMNYSFTDAGAAKTGATTLYYRLRSVDMDNKIGISSVRMVRLGEQVSQLISISAFPNPVVETVAITIPSKWQGKKIAYQIFNNAGQVVVNNQTGSASQTESLSLGKLPAGMYILRVDCNGEIAQQKLVKR